MNKYVDFVSDEDFLKCVKKVIDTYIMYNESRHHLDVLKKSKNTVDEFKTIFDVCVGKITIEDWTKFELIRQYDKAINNKVGEFHQELLGKVDGWVDLGVGDETKLDLKKEDNSIFIELKNKYNTMNSSSTDKCREKLEKILEDYPNATAYWGYVVNKNYKSEDRVWVYHGRKDERIRRISGDKVYKLITGDDDALEKTFNAIPKAIVDILGKDYELSSIDKIY